MHGKPKPDSDRPRLPRTTTPRRSYRNAPSRPRPAPGRSACERPRSERCTERATRPMTRESCAARSWSADRHMAHVVHDRARCDIGHAPTRACEEISASPYGRADCNPNAARRPVWLGKRGVHDRARHAPSTDAEALMEALGDRAHLRKSDRHGTRPQDRAKHQTRNGTRLIGLTVKIPPPGERRQDRVSSAHKGA